MPPKKTSSQPVTASLPKVAAPKSLATKQAQAANVVSALKAAYPQAPCALDYKSPFQLLIAVILSAQCTDVRVNMVTPELFRRWPKAEKMAQATQEELEEVIKSTGFYRNKATNIRGCCQALVEQHAGQVPSTLDQLVQLPGVGRKTANVVLGECFGIATGVVVDTHVGRLSQRLGLTKNTDAVKIEQDLIPLLPESEWILFSHRMIHHGRRVCDARKPLCSQCTLLAFCPRVGLS